jgi:hypothetical protein
MASQKKILRVQDSVALIGEIIYIFIPALAIEHIYAVNSRRRPDGVRFSTLEWAKKYFQAEVELCKAAAGGTVF